MLQAVVDDDVGGDGRGDLQNSRRSAAEPDVVGHDALQKGRVISEVRTQLIEKLEEMIALEQLREPHARRRLGANPEARSRERVDSGQGKRSDVVSVVVFVT